MSPRLGLTVDTNRKQEMFPDLDVNLEPNLEREYVPDPPNVEEIPEGKEKLKAGSLLALTLLTGTAETPPVRGELFVTVATLPEVEDTLANIGAVEVLATEK